MLLRIDNKSAGAEYDLTLEGEITMPKAIVTYYYRGKIERGNGRGYDWKEGYSRDSEDGKPLYPWNTKRECQQEAKAAGAQAVFQDIPEKRLT